MSSEEPLRVVNSLNRLANRTTDLVRGDVVSGKSRYSPWVETTWEQGEKELLLPLRARLRVKGSKVRGEAWVLTVKGHWKFYMHFPWVDLGFVPTEGGIDTLAEAQADSIIEWMEKHEAEGLKALLARAPEVQPGELVGM